MHTSSHSAASAAFHNQGTLCASTISRLKMSIFNLISLYSKQYITVHNCCQLFYTVILYILSNESAYPCSLITSHFDLQTKNISTDKKKDGFGYKIFQIYLSSYQILNPHCYVSLHRITALQGTHLIRLKNCF